MKKNILLYMAAVAGLVLAGCNKEIVPPQEDSLDMTVTARIGDLTKMAYDGASTTFQTGDQIAVWAWTGASDALPRVFTVDGIVNTLDESGKWVPASQMLWKNVHDKHYFMAVHPVPAYPVEDLAAEPYEVDNTNYEASDLLLANELTGLTAEAKTVDLAFTHAMAKLQVNLKFRGQFGPDGPAPESVTAALVGKATATVNYLTKEVTPTGTDGPVGMVPVAKAEGYSMSFSGIQIPQEATKIVVTVGEHSFTYTHPTALPIEPGKVTALGFNVGQDLITVESVTVTPWVSDEPLAGGEAVRSMTIDLAELDSDYEVQDGEILVGTLGANVKISIAAGATVTLGGMSINGVQNPDYRWAGITCLGDATIILKDGTTNVVKGFYQYYPGIWVPKDKTLTIMGESEGTGKLTASNNDSAAGIGAGWGIKCGNITILGGDITAIGGTNSAGIGGSLDSGSVSGSCGNILIAGGTVTAKGGAKSPGIGSGSSNNASCGIVTITDGVTKVIATKGYEAERSIGAGNKGTCGTVTIGGTVYPDGISESPYVYLKPSPFDNLTAQDVGRVIGADGKIYDNATAASTASTTAVAIIAYVGNDAETNTTYNHGLALALADANGGNKAAWSSVAANCLGKQYGSWDDPTVDMSGIANTDMLVSDGHDHDAASAARNYNGGTYPAGTSEWFLPSAGQWQKMITAAGSYANLVSNANLKSENDPYWSSTEKGNGSAWTYAYGKWDYYGGTSFYVRACLAF